MSVRMLLPPEREEQRWHLGNNSPGTVHLGVAGWAERDHEVENGTPRPAVVHRDGPFAKTTRSTNPARVPIPLQYELAQTAKVLRILPPKGVADSAHAIGQDLLPPTSAIECSLLLSAHFSLLILF